VWPRKSKHHIYTKEAIMQKSPILSPATMSCHGYSFEHDDLLIQVAGKSQISGYKETKISNFSSSIRSLYEMLTKRLDEDAKAFSTASIFLATIDTFFLQVKETGSINLSNPDANPHKEAVKSQVIEEYLPKFRHNIIRNVGMDTYQAIHKAWAGVEDGQVPEPSRDSVLEELESLSKKVFETIKDKRTKDGKDCACPACTLSKKDSNDDDSEPLRHLTLDGIDIGMNTLYGTLDHRNRMGVVNPFLEFTMMLSRNGIKERFKKAIEKDELFSTFMGTLEIFRDSIKGIMQDEDKLALLEFNIVYPEQSRGTDPERATQILELLKSDDGAEVFTKLLRFNDDQKAECLLRWNNFIGTISVKH
jgi:hypothetical protein